MKEAEILHIRTAIADGSKSIRDMSHHYGCCDASIVKYLENLSNSQPLVIGEVWEVIVGLRAGMSQDRLAGRVGLSVVQLRKLIAPWKDKLEQEGVSFGMRHKAQRFTPEQKEQMLADYEASTERGRLGKMARRLKVSGTRVQQLLREAKANRNKSED